MIHKLNLHPILGKKLEYENFMERDKNNKLMPELGPQQSSLRMS